MNSASKTGPADRFSMLARDRMPPAAWCEPMRVELLPERPRSYGATKRVASIKQAPSAHPAGPLSEKIFLPDEGPIRALPLFYVVVGVLLTLLACL